MKKVLCAFFMLMLISFSTFAAQPIYTKTTKETVTGGVSRINIEKFYGEYSLNINIITADLKNGHLSLELLKSSKGCDKVDTVMNLAKSDSTVVAATNADFFSAYKGDQNFSLGLEIKDGELLQSHINSNMAAGLFEDGALLLSSFQFSGTVTAPNGSASALAHINKPTDYYGAVLMYTPEFNGGISPFLPSGITAVTVVNDTVTAKGVSLGGTIPIPENGYILVIDDNMTPFLEYNFNIGDPVKVDISTTLPIESTQTAFGGGTLLLKDGKKTPITHNVSGNHPRTAIGTNADGTVIYLLTVDGRQTVSRGVSLDTLADICLEAGMVHAMNFDGGGSTAMVAKTLSNDSVHYINSPSEKRKVINAVAITSDLKPGETAGYIASASSAYVLSGDSVKLNLTPYDKNYNKPSGTPHSHEWVVSEGQGYVKDDTYYAAGSGKTVLDLYYNGQKTDSVTLNVISEVCGINATSHISIEKGASKDLGSVFVFDKYGNTAPVNNINLLNPEYNKSFISLSGKTVKAFSEGSGSINFYIDGAVKSVGVICGSFDAPVVSAKTNDTLYSTATGGFSFNVLASTPSETLLDRLIYKHSAERFRNAGACAIIGGEYIEEHTPYGLNPITAKSFKESDYQSVKVISLALTDKGVLSRGKQWAQLDTALKGGVQKNVIILLDKKPGFTMSLDSKAFEDIIQNAAKTKNVFVVYCGDENSAVVRNGVRYISVSDSKDGGDVKSTVENMKYLSFNITQDNITYCFRNLYTAESSDAENGGIVLE